MREAPSMMGVGEYRLGYRADIEGLRAVAILLVIAAHAGVPWLAGGFVGVDVFFVLSGFLITGLLVQEITGTGHVRFADFYIRRLRRLLPALLVMLMGAGMLAAWLLAPEEQPRQATAAAMAAVWLSNIHFAFAGLDYFAAGSESNLFLHTWSLGVEEQFYLIWPALLLWVLGKGAAGDRNLSQLKAALCVVGGASLLSCVVLTSLAPQLAFYMMPLRAWQFSAGGLAWVLFQARGNAHAPPASGGTGMEDRAFLRWAGWLGLIMVAAAGLSFGTHMPYPGVYALLPTLGAVGVIAAGTLGTNGGVSRLLSLRPLQAIGRVSYSWYLWHWPILLLGDAIAGAHSPIWRAGAVACSFCLAVASHRYVEMPIRHQSRWLTRQRMAILGSLALMVLANALCIRWHNLATAEMHSPDQLRYAKAHGDAPVIYGMGCDDWYHSDRVRICAFGPARATHTAVLMGDSIAGQWFPAVAELFNRPDWRLLVLTKSSCPMVDEPFFYGRIGREYTECTVWRRHALERVATLKPDIVLMGTVASAGFTREQWIEGTRRVLQSINAAVGHVYVLRGTPHLPFDGPNCLAKQNGHLAWLGGRSACTVPLADAHDDDVYQWLRQAGHDFRNVSMVDLNDKICPNGICAAERGHMVVFRDSQHMTATFAASLEPALSEQVGLANFSGNGVGATTPGVN